MIKCECKRCRFEKCGYCEAIFDIHIGVGTIFDKSVPMCQDYEEDPEIEVGDEVIISKKHSLRIYVSEVYSDCVSGFALCDIEDICEFGDRYSDVDDSRCIKTGRHFKDFREVLREITGE